MLFRSSKKILSFFTAIHKSSISIIEPSYLDVGIMSTLRNKVFCEKISHLEYTRLLNDYLAFDINIFQVSRKLLKLANIHSVKSDQPVIYDCIYSALAEDQKALFVTADQKFLKRIKKAYKHSYSVSEAFELIKGY